MPKFFRFVSGIRRQVGLADSEGLIGYSLDAYLLAKLAPGDRTARNGKRKKGAT